MAIIDKIKKLSKSLFPTGRAFKMPVGGSFEKLILGLAASEERAYEDALSILDSAIPDNDNFTEEDASQWERRLGLIVGSGTLEQRKQTIVRKMNHPGIVKARQHQLFIESQLQSAGFNVDVVENLNIGGTGLGPINPSNGLNLAVWETQVNSVDNNFTKIVFGGGLFVAISNSGTGNRVMTSPDGITWTTRTTPQDSNWCGLTYGLGLFVAVSSDGASQVMTSPDGITWTLRTAASSINWVDVTFGGDRFVAVGNSGNPLEDEVVMVSTNGTSWTIIEAFANKTLRRVFYGNGRFVAVGDSFSMRSSSSTASVWNQVTIDAYSWRSICYGKNRFIAISNNAINRIAISRDDGASWEYVNVPLHDYSSVCFGDNHFIAISTDGDTIYSIDGLVWKSVTPSNTNNWVDIFNGDNLFVAVSNDGAGDRVMTVSFTNDGICVDKIDEDVDKYFAIETVNTVFFIGELIDYYAWYGTTSPNNGWYAIAFGDNLFVAVGRVGTDRIMTSPDGINWTSRTNPDLLYSSIAYGNGYFIVVSLDGTNRVIRSADGITWDTMVAADAIAWEGVCFGNGLFVAVSGATAQVYRSDDNGDTWTLHSCPGVGFVSITYANGIFVAVAVPGTGTNRVMTSPDGINWTLRTTPNKNYNKVCFGNGIFVIIGGSTFDQVATSPDGITWTSQTVPSNFEYVAITFGNGRFVAVPETTGGGQQAMTSTDGINWDLSDVVDGSNIWKGVTYGNGLFVAVGTGGTYNSMLNEFYTMSNQDVPIERKDEFRQLILKLKPKQLIATLYINYV